MLELRATSKFKKDYKRAVRQGRDMDKLRSIIEALCRGDDLPESAHDHLLSGNYANHRECHVEPDWLLVYRLDESALVLTTARLGSHSELFEK